MQLRPLVARFFAAYGMIVALAVLCLYFTVATFRQEPPTGNAAAPSVQAALPKNAATVIVIRPDPLDREFAAALVQGGLVPVATIEGDPPKVRAALEALGKPVAAVATTAVCRDWALWSSLKQANPAYAQLQVIAPATQGGSLFLSSNNLRNVTDQIGVIALIAVGMTLVILTGGIDLSVGSLVALSAVVTAWLIQRWGGASASVGAQLAAGLVATVLCGLIGGLSGGLIAGFRLPPFIATLGMMQVASGLAFLVAKGQTLYDLPSGFTWLGRGMALGLSHAVWLMLLCYGAAHFFLNRMPLGRHLYAVGGNPEASRLSGIVVPRVLLLAYVVSGLTAGMGGVILASQLNAGAPTYGTMYELYVIAAVVVGGTSLAGGEGRVLGTLIGALIIAVIQNGMNLLNVEAYTQKVVLGLVILGAVLLDTLRRRRRRA